MQLFYVPDMEDGETAILSERESFHCVHVFRMSLGDTIYLTDGKGNLYEGIIIDPGPYRCRCKITNRWENYGKYDYSIHVAIAPTKGMERLEWFVEKATEIGINTITPIVCEHSEKKNVRMERLEKVVTVAMKQSLKAYRPLLNDPVSFSDFITRYSAEVKTIAVCKGDRKALTELPLKNKEVLLMIGPEGDFSEKEVQMAMEHDFIPISLGKERLRTETAGVVACHSIHLLNTL